MNKAELRAAMRAWRAGLDDAWVASASLAAQARLLALPEYGAARRVACYLATAKEVQTADILRRCRADGRLVCVPVWRPSANAYGLGWIGGDGAPRRGPHGIAEPVDAVWVEADEPLDLMVVPGVAFDACGGRIGHGRGHYDRICGRPGAAAAMKVGLAFEGQIVAGVPMDTRDVYMDAVITERRTLRRGVV
jgi:5-formyltetrahydrofolate cyclo-ligase